MPTVEIHKRFRVRAEDTAHQLRKAKVVCPAGELIQESNGAVACRCRIEHSTIRARENPSSLLRYCMSDGYVECPTWRADQEREGVAPLVRPSEGR